jgi:hypothetical protein
MRKVDTIECTESQPSDFLFQFNVFGDRHTKKLKRNISDEEVNNAWITRDKKIGYATCLYSAGAIKG